MKAPTAQEMLLMSENKMAALKVYQQAIIDQKAFMVAQIAEIQANAQASGVDVSFPVKCIQENVDMLTCLETDLVATNVKLNTMHKFILQMVQLEPKQEEVKSEKVKTEKPKCSCCQEKPNNDAFNAAKAAQTADLPQPLIDMLADLGIDPNAKGVTILKGTIGTDEEEG